MAKKQKQKSSISSPSDELDGVRELTQAVACIRQLLGGVETEEERFREATRYLKPGEKLEPLSQFIYDTGRWPRIGDDVSPWDYRGWLMPYRMIVDTYPGVGGRYDYVTRTIEAGRLLDEPLPQMHFFGENDSRCSDGVRQTEKMMDIVGYRSSSWNAFRDICYWLGWALGCSNEKPEIDADLSEKLYRLFNLEPWLLYPADYLGRHMEETQHNKKGGFFATPMHICTMMAQMTFGDGDQRAKMMHEPCVGSGRMMLAASNYTMRMTGQDVDPLCILVTKINLALYAPWAHVPESFFAEFEPVKDYKVEPVEIPIIVPPEPAPAKKKEKPARAQLSLFDED